MDCLFHCTDVPDGGRENYTGPRVPVGEFMDEVLADADKRSRLFYVAI